MAAKKRKRLFYNFIWTIILAVLLALPTLGVMEVSTLALEQETRCGQQEHSHTQECYFQDLLMCERKAHNHGKNCYLVLLEDNDINWLLATIEDSEEKSLENVIDSAMVQALHLNPNLTSVNSQQVHLAAESIRQLNDVIEENHIEPAVVLNENIRDNYLSYVPPQPKPQEEETTPSEETTLPAQVPSETEIINPTVPVQPVLPPVTEATEPVETTEATEPTETTETTEPTETTEATEPTETTEATEPTETTEPTEPPVTTEPTEPPVTTEPTEPPVTTEPTEPPVNTEPTEPPVTTEPTEPPVTTEPTEPPVTTEPTEPPVTTEPTEPPVTTEPTEPPVTTEPTEPPVTTEPTEPPVTTEPTEPPVTTEPTEPPVTTEPTEPPVTTEPTEPPVTTEPTEPPVTTEPTEPPVTTEPTEPPVTTEPTEAPEETESTEPSEAEEETEPGEEETEPTEETEPAGPIYMWQTGREIPVLAENPASYGQAALYLYHGNYWVCVDVLDMTTSQIEEQIHYSLSLADVRDAYRNLILISDESLVNRLMHHAPQSPAFGIDGIERVEGDSLYFGTDGTVRHIYLTDVTVNEEEQTVYVPVSFRYLTLDYTNTDPALEREEGYVLSGANAGDVCPDGFLWQTEQGDEPQTITEDVILYALPASEEVQQDPLAEEERPPLLMFAPAPDNLLMAAGEESNASARALGGDPNTNRLKANFYLQLDGVLTFVNTKNLTSPSSMWGSKYCSYSDAVTAYTSESSIVTGLTTGNLSSSYWFYYNTSGNFNQNRTATSIYNNRVYFSNSNNAHYAVLTRGNGNSYDLVDFYTVKLDYSAVDGVDQIQYVEEGLNSTFVLSDEYMWYLDQENTVPATMDSLKSISKQTTLYATYKNRTVTYVTNCDTQLEPAVVQHGDLLERPEDPVKEGFVLEGWYTDEGMTQRFDFSTPVTDHMTLYAKWAQACTVSFVDEAGETILESMTVGAGMELTLPEFYSWIAADGQVYQGGTKITILEDTVFVGDVHTFTLTFHANDQIHAVMEEVPYGSTVELPADPLFDGHRFRGWYSDEAYTQTFSRETPVSGDMDLYAQWEFDITLNYLDLEGNVKNRETVTHVSGDILTLPEHYQWTDPGADAEDPADDTVYNGGSTVTLMHALTLIGNPNRYAVSFVDGNGESAADIILLEYGSSFFFPETPESCVWEGSDGSHYVAGDYYDAVYANLTFTAVETSVTIHYNVNFPSAAASLVDKVPTLYGTTSATASDNIPGGTTATVRSLTSNTARREISSSNKESITFYFQGWKVEGTETVIPSDTVLNWSMLAQYADARGNITLTGQWEDGSRINSVTFFVQFNSVAMDTEGNITSRPIENFTQEIFNTHLGGLPSTDANKLKQFEIADTTSDNSYGADQKIRALYGERANGIWMYEFPRDDDVFVYLKEYLQNNPSKSLSVDGESVKIAELDSKHYAIRWYVFKLEGSSWHVDGKLVRREGQINIYKSFQGVGAALSSAESGFYIVAENGTKDASGKFTPYSSSDSHFKQYVLNFDGTASPTLKDRYPKAVFAGVTQGNSGTHSYFWRIRSVVLDEHWRITEYPNSNISGYSHYAEYSIYDSEGELTAVAEYGTQASVVGKTFALDEDPEKGLTVEFTNYYFDNHSILLKKEDAATGEGISGAGFNFIQKGNVLSFEFMDEGSYNQNPNASNTDILTGSNGYVTVQGFSYQYGADSNQGDRGSIIIEETVVPTGYGLAATVELGLDGDENVYIARVTNLDGTEVPREKWSQYVELPRNDVLVIKNQVTDLISVTAKKEWGTNVRANSVDVILQANGVNADKFGVTTQVTLNKDNNWSYTWENLPRYSGGQPVSWGIKEVKVGDAPTLSDGVSFANWIPVYSPAVATDRDGNGSVDNLTYTVTNYSKTPKLILTKVGADDEGLAGATFTLEQVELGADGWQRVRGTSPVSQTTNSSGVLTFENLVGTYTYRLTEVKAPTNHIIVIESLIFTVDGDGNIQKLDDSGAPVPITSEFLTHDSAYHLRVKNLISVIMPETGGSGTYVYWLCGIALMLTALLLYIYPSRKEDRASF